MKLSKTERLILSNQYRILEALYPSEREDLAKVREAVEKGYTLHYGWCSDHIYEDELSPEQCKFVFNVLTMYEHLQRAYERAGKEKSGIDPWKVKFHGFDGNNETVYMAYARYLRDREQRYTYLELGDDGFNSHTPSLSKYRSMLARWERTADKHNLTESELKVVLADDHAERSTTGGAP